MFFDPFIEYLNDHYEATKKGVEMFSYADGKRMYRIKYIIYNKRYEIYLIKWIDIGKDRMYMHKNRKRIVCDGFGAIVVELQIAYRLLMLSSVDTDQLRQKLSELSEPWKFYMENKCDGFEGFEKTCIIHGVCFEEYENSQGLTKWTKKEYFPSVDSSTDLLNLFVSFATPVTPVSLLRISQLQNNSGQQGAPEVKKTPKPKPDRKPEYSVREANEDEPTCCLCKTNYPDFIILPCAHMCLCHPCSVALKDKSKKCPKCRSEYKNITKAYQ